MENDSRPTKDEPELERFQWERRELELERFRWEKKRFMYLLTTGLMFAAMIFVMVFQFYYVGRSQMRDYEYMFQDMKEDVRKLDAQIERLDNRMLSVLSEQGGLNSQINTILKNVEGLQSRLSDLEKTVTGEAK